MIATLLAVASKVREAHGARALVLGLLAVLACSTAMAAPGDGIHLGSRVSFKPVLRVDFSYDSNVNRSSGGGIDSGALSVRPALTADYDHEELTVRLSYEHFIQQYLSPDAASYSYYDDLVAKLDSQILPHRVVGLEIRDVVSSRSYGYRSEYDNFVYGLMERSYNDLGLIGRYSPGQALDLFLGLHWLYNLENLATNLLSGAPGEGGTGPGRAKENSLGVSMQGKWRFFPKTMLLVEMNYSRGKWQNTPECSQLGVTASECGTTPSARLMYKSPVVNQWSLLSGIAGQVTNTIQAKIYLGYGGLYNSEDPNDVSENVGGWDGLLAQVAFTYSPIDTQHVSLEFDRRYADSSIHDYFITNSFFLVYSGMFASRVQLSARAGMDFRVIDSTEVASDREFATHNDRVFSSSLQAEYHITRWLTATTSFEPTVTVAVPNEDSSLVSPDGSVSYAEWLDRSFSYRKFVFAVGVRGTY